MTQSINFFDDAERQVNESLREKGIVHDIFDLYRHPDWSPNCVPELLELFKSASTFQMRQVIATALFARKPNRDQKRSAIEAILTLVRANPTRHNDLSTLILNDLANNIDPDKVHEIGEMTLDKRYYGNLRAEFTYVLYKIGNDEAIAYLLQAAKDPVAASLALAGLAKLRVPETMALCEEALNNPDIRYKEAIRETYSKLKRKAAKKSALPSHLTGDPVPEGLEEWSSNLDGGDLPKVLKAIQKCVEAGFGRAEIAETRAAADDLDADQTARLRFPAKFAGKESDLWLEVFCDDENAFDVYVFGAGELIRTIETAIEKVLHD